MEIDQSTPVSVAASTSNNNETNNNNNNNNRIHNNKRHVQNHSDDSDMESRASTEQSSLHLQNELDEIELVLKPHPLKEITLNSNRFLKTTSNATSIFFSHLFDFIIYFN
jgi:hypothetical protein